MIVLEGRNIAGSSDHNIAYEIRLQKSNGRRFIMSFSLFEFTDLEIGDDTMVNETN